MSLELVLKLETKLRRARTLARVLLLLLLFTGYLAGRFKAEHLDMVDLITVLFKSGQICIFA